MNGSKLQIRLFHNSPTQSQILCEGVQCHMHVSVHVLLHCYADEMMMLVEVVVEVKVNLMEASAMESKGEV